MNLIQEKVQSGMPVKARTVNGIINAVNKLNRLRLNSSRMGAMPRQQKVATAESFRPPFHVKFYIKTTDEQGEPLLTPELTLNVNEGVWHGNGTKEHPSGVYCADFSCYADSKDAFIIDESEADLTTLMNNFSTLVEGTESTYRLSDILVFLNDESYSTSVNDPWVFYSHDPDKNDRELIAAGDMPACIIGVFTIEAVKQDNKWVSVRIVKHDEKTAERLSWNVLNSDYFFGANQSDELLGYWTWHRVDNTTFRLIPGPILFQTPAVRENVSTTAELLYNDYCGYKGVVFPKTIYKCFSCIKDCANASYPFSEFLATPSLCRVKQGFGLKYSLTAGKLAGFYDFSEYLPAAGFARVIWIAFDARGGTEQATIPDYGTNNPAARLFIHSSEVIRNPATFPRHGSESTVIRDADYCTKPVVVQLEYGSKSVELCWGPNYNGYTVEPHYLPASVRFVRFKDTGQCDNFWTGGFIAVAPVAVFYQDTQGVVYVQPLQNGIIKVDPQVLFQMANCEKTENYIDYPINSVRNLCFSSCFSPYCQGGGGLVVTCFGDRLERKPIKTEAEGTAAASVLSNAAAVSALQRTGEIGEFIDAQDVA